MRGEMGGRGDEWTLKSYLPQKVKDTFFQMPNVIIMFSRWQILSCPLCSLLMPNSNKYFDLELPLSEMIVCSNEAFFLHTVAPLDLIALM